MCAILKARRKKDNAASGRMHSDRFFALHVTRFSCILAGMSDVSRILSAIVQGDPQAAHELLPLVYEELRRLAAHRLAQEKPGQTLEPTALVHEAYIRLVGKGAPCDWQGRGHFFAAAAEAMRRILIENARRKHGPKHGGRMVRVDIDLNQIMAGNRADELLALDEALKRLAEESPTRARLVELRFFAGLTVTEAAEVLGISEATAERYWTYARTWLFAQLSDVSE
jgi:RNA polymerase sigma factor (TIGR02999 family)